MRNAITILMTLAFTAVFPANKIKASVQDANIQLCFYKYMAASHVQKEFITDRKDYSAESYFQECSEIEDDGIDDDIIDSKEKFVFLNSLTTRNSISFVAASKFNCNKQYVNPYNIIVRLPFYILHRTLIIPFS